MPDPIEENLRRLRQRIARACGRSGRDASEVHLVAVTKTFPASVVSRALEAGIRDIGENRVQELREKAEQVSGPVRWHLIGHLQSNKAKLAARLCEVIQTVDSASLARKLSSEAVAAGRELEVLIQVNIGDESQKSGVAPAEATALAQSIRGLEGLRLRGLMTIPPLAGVDQARQYFRQLRELRDKLRDEPGGSDLNELSMGMTDDFEIAVEEGSTMVRVGRALFGERG